MSFGFGFFLVLIGWPFIGMIAESYGLIALFRFVQFSSVVPVDHPLVFFYVSVMKQRHLGDFYLTAGTNFLHSGFWPTAAVYLQRSPAFGWIFQHPFVTSVRSQFRTHINSSHALFVLRAFFLLLCLFKFCS